MPASQLRLPPRVPLSGHHDEPNHHDRFPDHADHRRSYDHDVGSAARPWSSRLSAEGLTQPVLLLSPPGETTRIVLERTGLISILNDDGSIAPEPFLDLRDRVNSGGIEQGFLGMAFHPDFRTTVGSSSTTTAKGRSRPSCRSSLPPPGSEIPLPSCR